MLRIFDEQSFELAAIRQNHYSTIAGNHIKHIANVFFPKLSYKWSHSQPLQILIQLFFQILEPIWFFPIPGLHPFSSVRPILRVNAFYVSQNWCSLRCDKNWGKTEDLQLITSTICIHFELSFDLNISLHYFC